MFRAVDLGERERVRWETGRGELRERDKVGKIEGYRVYEVGFKTMFNFHFSDTIKHLRITGVE